MLHIWIGRANTGKTARVLRRIRELGDRSRQILLVPEHASHQMEVELCRFCGDTASRHGEVLSFRRLAERVLSVTGGAAEASLDPGGKLLTLQRCVSELSPSLTVYRRPSRKPAFLEQLLSLFDELRAYAVTPETLEEKAAETAGATREKLRDLSLLYAAYEARLRDGGRDLRDRMSRLRDNLETSGYARDKDVFLLGFAYFNVQERDILEIFLKQARSVTVALLGELDSREEIFLQGLKTLEQLKRIAKKAGCPVKVEAMAAARPGALGYLERHFFGSVPGKAEIPGSGESPDRAALPANGEKAIRVREASNLLSEVEQTAAEILRLTAAGKARFRDIAVTARNLEEYAGTLETVFARWGIPVYLNRRFDILEKPAFSLLTGVLSSVANGYEYEDMFRWLKTGLAGLDAEECAVLENYVLKWEIHGQMWLRDVDWTENPDGYGVPLEERRQARLEQVNALRRRVREPLAALAAGLKNGETAAQKADALYQFMERLGLQEALEARMREQAAAGRLQEAEETAQLWEILCGVLDQFVEISGPERLDTDTFQRLFRLVLTQYSVGAIPVSLDQVSAGELTRNDRFPVKYLFLLGVNDHVIPAPGQNSGILNEDDREELAKAGVELAPAGMEQMGMELFYLYTALSRPTAGLIVSYPLSDASGGILRPAFVIERLRTLFPSLTVEGPEAGFRLTAKIPALEAAGEQIGGSLWNYFAQSGAYENQLAAMERAAALRRGSLSPGTVRALYGRRVSLSASRMERMRSCHFAYFMEYGLRAKPRKAAAFDAPQIGTFLHFLLENVTRDVLRLGGFRAVENPALHDLTKKYIRKFEEDRFGDISQKSARFRYLFARLRRTAAAIVDEAAEELRHSDFIPLAFELSVGEPDGVPAVVIHDPEGEIRVGGRADRVDGWIQDGKLYLRVVDYKSGKKKFDLGAVRMGLDLQMLLYLFALPAGGVERLARAIAQQETQPESGGAAQAAGEEAAETPGNIEKMPLTSVSGAANLLQAVTEIVPAGALYFPARDEILTAARDASPEELRALREKELRRTGLILSEPDVLKAMEHEALTQPHYLPIRMKKDGIAGSLASAEQLGKLRRYVGRILREIAGEIRAGCIDADPCRRTPGEDPCQYCAWAAACHFQDGRDTDRLRAVPSMDAARFWAFVDQTI